MEKTCIFCSKQFSSIQSLKRHYERKNRCIGVSSQKNDKKISKGIIFSHQKNDTFLSKNDILKNNLCEQKNLFNCRYCDKSYKHKSNKYRHEKQCKLKYNDSTKLKNLEDELSKLKNQLKNLKNNNNINNNNTINNNVVNDSSVNNNNSSINDNFININSVNDNTVNTVNNTRNSLKKNKKNQNSNSSNNYSIINNNCGNNYYNISNYNQINITINGYGKENLDGISKKEILEILNKRFEAFSAALEKIYTIPENQNFYQPNKRDNRFIKVFDGLKTYYEDRNYFLINISHKIMDQLEDWFDIHNKNIKVHRRKLIEHIFEEFNRGELYEKYKRDVDKFLMTYSNSIKKIFEKNIQNIRNQINQIETKK